MFGKSNPCGKNNVLNVKTIALHRDSFLCDVEILCKRRMMIASRYENCLSNTWNASRINFCDSMLEKIVLDQRTIIN